MSKFRSNILYEAAQLKVPVREAADSLFFVEGFEIKSLKNKLRISGFVYLNRTRSMQVLFETTSMEYANQALRRTMLVSREFSRIKSFPGICDDPQICVQIELSHHCTDATHNFIVQASKYGNALYWQTPCVEISVRYRVPCINDKQEHYFWIANQTYQQRRLEESKHHPHQHEFTVARKYAQHDFANGARLEDLQSLHKVNLPYRILSVRVEKVEQYDTDSQEIFKEYGITLPPDKVQVEYLAIKAPRPVKDSGEDYVIAS